MTRTRAVSGTSRRTARAFTLMEVVLAGVLGLMVVISSMGFFTAMDRAKRLQNERLEQNAEMNTAHRVIQQALRSLLMNDGANMRDEDQKDKIAKNLADAVEHPLSRDEEAAKARFALQPDLGATTSEGLPTQSLEVTLVTPPIHAVSMLSESERQEAEELREMLMYRQRKIHLWESGSSKSRNAETKDSGASKNGTAAAASESDAQRSKARSDRLRLAAAGLTGSEADPTLVEKAASQEIEPPRAPGLRGVFELRAEDDPKVLARLAESGAQGGAMALWWRQVPTDDAVDAESEETERGGRDAQLIELARRSRSDAPQIKLLTGLKDARWQVYRRRKMLPKMSATTAKELPAYVEFQFETLGGRREDWLFEVSWSYGPDPGTVMAANDVLGGPAGATAQNGLPGDIQGLIDRAVAQGTPGGGTGSTPTGNTTGTTGSTVGGTRPVAQGGGGNKGSGGGGRQPIPGGGANGVSQAEIDAILRQFGFQR